MAATKTKQKQEEAQAQEAARAAALRESVRTRIKSIQNNYIDLSAELAEIHEKEYFKTYGFESFQEYANSELDFQYRKAKYLVDIWRTLEKYPISRERLERIGWTKFIYLHRHLTEENLEQMLTMAENSSVADIKAQLSGITVDGGRGAVTVRLKMNQAEAAGIMEAIAAAKEMLNSDNDVSALEMICQDWMEYRGHSSEKLDLKHHIAYLNKVYGVNITAVGLEDAEVAPEATEEDTSDISSTGPDGSAQEDNDPVSIESILAQVDGEENTGKEEVTEGTTAEDGEEITDLDQDWDF